jgi:hypothetical protein
VRRILLRALALRDAHNAGAVDAAALLAEADHLGAQLDKLAAGRPATRPTGGCSTTSPSSVRICSLRAAARRASHQLARRAGHPPRRGDPQELGW